jgi:hypothetical protein
LLLFKGLVEMNLVELPPHPPTSLPVLGDRGL